MSTTTPNLGLIKPELSDPANITVMNENWDKIDAELKRQADATVDVSEPINTHNTSGSAHSDIRTAVSEAKQSASQALTDAKSYTDTKIAGIPTPDVSGQIGTHNTDSSAHADIRNLASNALPRDGSKPMSGALWLSAAKLGRVTALSNSTVLENFRSTADTDNGATLEVSSNYALEDSLKLNKTTSGNTTSYKVYGEHNITKGTADLTAGTSPLADGAIYFVYE